MNKSMIIGIVLGAGVATAGGAIAAVAVGGADFLCHQVSPRAALLRETTLSTTFSPADVDR